jgi:hypothetical protein
LADAFDFDQRPAAGVRKACGRLGYHVILPPFTLAECRRLFQMAQLGINDVQLGTVMEWTGGYPLLLQWSADALTRGDSLSAF